MLCMASNCDNQDVSALFEVRLTSDSPTVTEVFAQPYVGRIALDYGVVNDGVTDATITLRAQMQTDGNADAAVCEAFERQTPLSLEASPPEDGDAPQFPSRWRDQDQVYIVTLPEADEAFEGYLEFVISDTGTYRFYSDSGSASLSILTTEGAELSPVSGDGTLESCEGVGQVTTYALNTGTYAVRVESDISPVALYVEEACDSQRTVPRTCPGSVSQITAVSEPVNVAPGGKVAGRVGFDELGIGDITVVELTCSSPECDVRVELFFVIEQLDCRSTRDCRNSESCSEEGYCLRTAGGCAAARGARSATMAALLLGLILLRRRRLKRRSSHRAMWAGVLIGVVLTALPQPDAQAEPIGAQVYFQPGLSTQGFTGNVGRYSSGSIGVHATQGVQVGLLGAYLTLGTDYFLTNQPPPPFTRGLQTFLIAAGPRVAFGIDPMRVFVGVEYAHLGILSNSLTRFSGDRLHFSGIGTNLALRYEGLLPLYVEPQIQARWFTNVQETTFGYGFVFAVGMAGGI